MKNGHSQRQSGTARAEGGNSLYDHPAWYDLIYGGDWRGEYHFLRACFQAYAKGPVKRVFEPACGTGRLLLPLARAGYKVSGLDLNAAAVGYCRERLKRHGFSASIAEGDMCRFRLKAPVDAAFNTINSFRHLLSETQAVAHLRCMARAVAPGGLYLLGLHLTPLLGQATRSERWAVRRGHLAITIEMRSLSRSAIKRLERVRTSLDIYTPRAHRQFSEVLEFRTYTAGQFERLLAQVPAWEHVASHDFEYRADRPLQVDCRTEDVVYVLRRRGK